jgi:phage antirepressor YoqD-like protein
MQCYMMKIPFTDHVTNDTLLSKMRQKHKLLSQVKLRKLRYFGHVVRHHGLEKDVMPQAHVDREVRGNNE